MPESLEPAAPPADGRYDVMVIEVDPAPPPARTVRLELVITAGPIKGHLVTVDLAAEAIGADSTVDPLDALGRPGRLDVVDGRPTLRLDDG